MLLLATAMRRATVITTKTASRPLPSPLLRPKRRGLSTNNSTNSSGSGNGGGAGHNHVGPPPPSDPTAVAKAGAIGLTAGVFGSLVGMGGAFVMIPAMTGILKFSQHQAHGTSLAAVVATGSGGAMSYGGAEAVDWEAAMYVAGVGMFAARAGAAVTGKLSGATLKRLCGIFQIVVAPTVPLRNEILAFFGAGDAKEGGKEGGKEGEDEWKRRLQLMCIGAGSGFLAGLFGVGGGAVTIPALTLCLDMSHYQALGTSLAAMVPTAIVGTYSHHGQGHVVWSLVAPLALGSLCGSYFGGKDIALQVPEAYLKWGFGIMMIVLGAKSIHAAGPLRSAMAAAKKG